MPIKKRIKVANVGWFANDEGPECETVAFCDTNKAKLEELKKCLTEYCRTLPHTFGEFKKQ